MLSPSRGLPGKTFLPQNQRSFGYTEFYPLKTDLNPSSLHFAAASRPQNRGNTAADGSPSGHPPNRGTTAATRPFMGKEKGGTGNRCRLKELIVNICCGDYYFAFDGSFLIAVPYLSEQYQISNKRILMVYIRLFPSTHPSLREVRFLPK